VRAGGSILSNLATISLDYQTSYAPFAGRSPFVNTLVLSARVNVLNDWQVQVTTYTLPNGIPRYTVSASRFFYRAPTGRQARTRTASNIPKYLVEGRVVDDSGNGVRGAVLEVGNDTVITGDDGRFFARFARRRALPVTVRVSEFPSPHRFSVVSSPERVTPRGDEDRAEVTIVVHKGEE
jgi:hypothetical protein